MDSSPWLARLLAIAAVLETVTALALLVNPSAVASILLQSGLEATGEAVGRIAGGGLLSLGIACWCARETPSAPSSLGVAWALLAYNAVASATLASAVATMTSDGLAASAAAILHGLFGAALLAILLLRRRQARTRREP